jgi:hypothetical protein
MPSNLIIQETLADLARRAVNGDVTLTLVNVAPGAYSTVVTADGSSIEVPPGLTVHEGDTVVLSMALPLHRPMLTPFEAQQGWQGTTRCHRDQPRHCGFRSSPHSCASPR